MLFQVENKETAVQKPEERSESQVEIQVENKETADPLRDWTWWEFFICSLSKKNHGAPL